jgi:hypothetical protein
MRRYAVYVPPGAPSGPGAANPPGPAAFSRLVLLREGFSWLGFLFGPIYAAACGMWTAALGALTLLTVAVGVPAILDLDALSRALAVLGYALLCGLLARDARAASLEDRGYRLHDVVAARNQAEALIRLAERMAGRAASAAEGSGSAPAGLATSGGGAAS